jgi:hypothetical protein
VQSAELENQRLVPSSNGVLNWHHADILYVLCMYRMLQGKLPEAPSFVFFSPTPILKGSARLCGWGMRAYIFRNKSIDMGGPLIPGMDIKSTAN